jgi:capsular polysaccharide transport system permease protein
MLRGFMLQFQVVHALILRETRTRFGTHRLGYAWALLEPVIMIATFAGLWSVMGRTRTLGYPTIPFLTTGFIPFILFRETSSRAVSAIDSNKGLLFYPQVRPLDLVLARIILEIVTSFVVFVLILGGYSLWSGGLQIGNLLDCIVGLLLASGLGAGLGLTLCSLTTFSRTVERLQGPLLRPLFWVSGVFYPSQQLPAAVREVVSYNPVLHVVEMVRSGFLPGYPTTLHSPLYTGFWVLGLLFLGLTTERIARRKLELT